MFLFEKKSDEVKKFEKLNKPHDGPKLAKMDNPNNVIEISNLKKVFTSEYGVSNILNGIDLEIYNGEFVVILGPSGSGKTTLMNIISGLDRATEGTVKVLGSNLINMNDDELTKFRRINVGYIFQQYGLIPNLKIRENIEVGSFLNKLNKKELEKNRNYELKLLDSIIARDKDFSKVLNEINFESYFKMSFEDFLIIKHFGIYNILNISEVNLYNKIINIQSQKSDSYYEEWKHEINNRYDEYLNNGNDQAIDEIMETLGIKQQEKKYPSQLSGGQQQRVSIARSFAKKPKILFADEPTGAVDGKMSDVILSSFVEINKKYGTTIIIVTHNDEIANLATKVINIKDGYIESVINRQNNI